MLPCDRFVYVNISILYTVYIEHIDCVPSCLVAGVDHLCFAQQLVSDVKELLGVCRAVEVLHVQLLQTLQEVGQAQQEVSAAEHPVGGAFTLSWRTIVVNEYKS